MEFKLHEFQKEAVENVLKDFEHGKWASVVIPTGCGKSFISLGVMENYKDKNILILSPSHEINNQYKKYIRQYMGHEKEVFPHMDTILYQGLLRISEDTLKRLNPDLIIFDELHRTGADKWGQKVDELLKLYPNAKVLGITATPDRTDEINIIDEKFSGNISYEMKMIEALGKGILKNPKYIIGKYAMQGELEDIRVQIDETQNEETKKELNERYERIRKIIGNVAGVSDIFKNNAKKGDKYILFCKDKNHMEEMMREAREWFEDIDESPEMYSVLSERGQRANEKEMKRFRNSKTENIKLLFSVDMLNEGVHIEGISGVIMLRPTESRIIYLQQLGRCLSANKEMWQPIVYDLVNNWMNQDRDLIEKIIHRKEESDRAKEPEEVEQPDKTKKETQGIDYEDVRVIEELKELRELFGEIYEQLGKSISLKNAKKIKEWCEREENKRLPKRLEKVRINPEKATEEEKEEYELSIKLNGMKICIINKYKKMSIEEIDNENHKGIVSIVRELENKYREESGYLKNARKIEKWCEENKRLPKYMRKLRNKSIKATEEEKEEYELATRLKIIKGRIINRYEEIDAEEIDNEDHKKIVSIVRELENKYREESGFLKNARELEQWCKENKRLPVMISKGKTEEATEEEREEYELSIKLNSVKKGIINKYKEISVEKIKNESHKKILAIIKELENNYKRENVYLKNAKEMKDWCEENRRLPKRFQKTRDELTQREEVELMLAKRLAVTRFKYKGKEIEEIEDEEEREIIEIVRELDVKYGKLSNLSNEEKRLEAQVEDAKKLINDYKNMIDGKEESREEGE